MSIHYAREQLGNAVAALATGTGSIQERIVEAWTQSLIHIGPERDLPEDLRTRWEMISTLATLEPAIAGEGKLRATILAMNDEEAVEVARHVLEFDYLVQARPPDQD